MSCVGGKKSSIPPNQRLVGSFRSLSGGAAFLPWVDLGVKGGAVRVGLKRFCILLRALVMLATAGAFPFAWFGLYPNI
jgi:hypothetical protein